MSKREYQESTVKQAQPIPPLFPTETAATFDMFRSAQKLCRNLPTGFQATLGRSASLRGPLENVRYSMIYIRRAVFSLPSHSMYSTELPHYLETKSVSPLHVTHTLTLLVFFPEIDLDPG